MTETVINCPRCGGCVLCGHADACPDPGIEISGDPEKSQCAIQHVGRRVDSRGTDV